MNTMYRLMAGNNLQSYRPFFDKEWAIRFHDEYKSVIGLGPIVGGLTARWRTISELFSMPVNYMDAVKGHVEPLRKRMEPVVTEFFHALKKNLRANDFDFSPVQNDRLFRFIHEFEEQVRIGHHSNDVPYDVNQGFDYFYHDSKNELFRISHGALIQNSFLSLFFAYEGFAKDCVMLLNGGVDVEKPFGKLEKLLGKQVYQDCWEKEEIERASQARNSIVHSGGKISEKTPHYDDYYVSDSETKTILIHPDGVRKLYANLALPVEILATAVKEALHGCHRFGTP